MSSRLPQTSRDDRSPPRGFERRPSSTTYQSGGSSYRGSADFSQPPPLGPKADIFPTRGGFPYSPSTRGRRGGTFSGRPQDNWDRERDRDRDIRQPPQSYRSRDDDRPEWPRRDRDLAPGDRGAPGARDSRPYSGRDRSASPVRTRRDSRESIPPLVNRPSESSSYYGASARGGLGRGRGRGDWDRSRGRNSFAGERDRELFSTRSRSRDGWRERDFERGRPSVAEPDRGDRYDRRDHERSRERDVRRDHDVWQRDHSPSRASIGATAGRGTSPTTTGSANLSHYGTVDKASKMDYELGRRPSSVITPGSIGRDRRELDQSDYFGGRTETPRRDGPALSYQTQPAQSPSATAGLDYGPPPSIPTSSAATVEKSGPSKPTTIKTDAPPAAPAPFQPPSGPKAERTASATINSQPSKSTNLQAHMPKADLSSRPLRATQGSGPSTGAPEPTPKLTDSKLDLKPPLPQTPDKSMPANVPQGPRSSWSGVYKPRQPSSEPALTGGPLTKTAPSEPRNLAIPTGPRFERDREMPTWSTAGVNRSWVSPEYNRAKPSIMNPLGRERPSFAPTGPRSQTILPPHNEKPRIFPVPYSHGASTASTSHGTFGQKAITSPARAFARSAGVAPTEDVDMSLPASSEDEDEFDEDDFAVSEEKHHQERVMLEARKPPPLLQDSAVRNLLIRIQFLDMIMHNVIPKPLDTDEGPDEKAKATEPSAIGLPSPDEMSDEPHLKPELKHPQPRGRPLSQPAVNPIPTPPIEDLPYLSRDSPKRIPFDESDDEVQHEAITTLIRQEFESAAFDWQDELQEIHTDFRQRYPLWKQEIAMLEHERRELQPSPAPASPAPSAAASVTPSLGHERTRGARNTTEADLQQAILMSQQSLKEEEERREREAASSSQPNYETEASVPAMMKPSDEELNFFDDTNKLIPVDLALDVFAYVPPEDDFTEEEQLAFIGAYCQHPKKWGKISESLPGRSYKDCITHYYLTKNEAKYKDIWRRSQPKRKRGRAATKPRSTALMSELVYDNDGDSVVAVTDTGRPRRAAAPTFGDTPGDSDVATPVPQSKRLALGSKESNGEPVVAKPGRGRKAGGVAKPRRTKAQMQADQQAAMLLPAGANDGSPQKAVASRDRARTLLRAENGAPKNDMTASPDLPRVVDLHMAPYPPVDADRPLTTTGHSTQPTSYWSVPEQQKFPQLIAYYGRDFTSIAEFMKTKTGTMIKNHYNRQIQDGKSDLEELARQADRRRAAGEPLGTPPSPAAQTKRRYEATPSTASITRPAALQPEHNLPEAEQASLTAKSTYTEDFPSNAVQRSLTGVDLVAKPRQPRDILREAQPVAPGQAKMEELQRSQIFGQKPPAGPRPGLFKEEALGFGLPHQNIHEHSPHQYPLRPGEPGIGDLRTQQCLLGQPRESIGASSQGVLQVPTTHGQSSVDKYGASLWQGQHGRSGSLGMVSHHPTLQDARDPTLFRRVESNARQSPYGLAPTQSPTSLPAQTNLLGRSDTSSTAPTPSEQPKPAPAKRSNLRNLLNDEPPESQPQKRTSFDSQQRTSMLSPQPVPVTSQSLSFEAARAQARPEDIHELHRSMQGPFGQPPASRLSNLSLRELQPTFPGSQGDQNDERWINRFDHRTQSGQGEQRGLHHSPRVGGYSVIPPSNNTHSSHQSIRLETQRSIDQGQADHRRMLGQLSHPGSNPSPPPQQGPQAVPPYRSLSGSSPHGRFGSGFSQAQSLSQPSPHMYPVQQPPGPPSHPPSAGSTPVSGLNHQNRPSQDSQHHRLTIQQYQAQQQQQHQQQHQHQHQHREREHEDALRRQRDMEAQQQQMRMPQRDRIHHDILSFGTAAPPSHHEAQSQGSTSHHHHSHIHSQHQHQHQQQQHQPITAGILGSRHLGIGGRSQQQQQQQQHQQHQQQEPVPRTFTPPPPPGGPYSTAPGPGPSTAAGLLSHGHHSPSVHQQGTSQQHQQQHQQHQQQHQQQGPTGHHGQGQGQHQPQSFGHAHAHFRGLSQGQGQGQGETR